MSDILRSNLKQLRPPNLSEFGLAHCLHELVNDWIYNHPQHQLELTINCNLRLLDEHMQLSCYRIIQEGLTNISRHAGNNVEAKILLYRKDNDIIIEVMDNGQGCDLKLIKKGYGLLGMRERVETVSGHIHIESLPGQGMKIKVKLPCGIGEIDGKN
jgi:two-component system sensor histidine kinase UhpB